MSRHAAEASATPPAGHQKKGRVGKKEKENRKEKYVKKK
jgi:hypothetical protein